MIGIVVVSHSRPLGEAVAALAREMAGGEPPPLSVAAGLDDTTFGTDAAAVSAAIEEVAESTDGVLVLVDIGSSVLSAELACEFIDPDLVERVRISAAPLVEGVVPAVVSAAGGADLDEVAREAAEGLAAKREHLGEADESGAEPASGSAQSAQHADVTIADPHGLHARPAAKLVALVRRFDAAVTVANLDGDGRAVPATSLSRVATLNAGSGARLRVTADGPQADDVLSAVQDLLTGNPADDAPGPPAPSPTEGAGTAAATRGSGLDAALGAAHVLQHIVNIDDYQPGSPDEEHHRSDRALEAVTEAIRRQQGNDPAVDDMLDAHLALLADDGVRDDVDERMAAGDPAPQAWQRVLRDLAADFEGLDDAYQRARAQDVRAIERQLLAALVTGPDSVAHESVPSIPAGSVVVVDELDPAAAAGLDASAIGGVVTVRGGDTGHGVIVARSRGIPVFTDGGEAATRARDGQTIGFDVATRLLVIDPDPEQTAELQQLLDRRRKDAEEASAHAEEAAVTPDGNHVGVAVNVGAVADASTPGADGSGLVRTEVLFGAARTAPSADEQAAAFVEIGHALGGRPITVRTWDVGGDKPLAFLPGARETNPMLGVRGLRLMRQNPQLLDCQLEAVCAAARQTEIRVMFPMVSTREEVDWALSALATAKQKVGTGPHAVGIMVEVPAAALRVAELAEGLDFVSIGTNDLTQYTLAADRGNAGVGDIADGLDPAVLQLIRYVADHVPTGVEVAVCGDLASRSEAVPLLLGLGVQEVSVTGPAVPRVKQAVRHTSLGAAREFAERALAAPSAMAVRELLAAPR